MRFLRAAGTSLLVLLCVASGSLAVAGQQTSGADVDAVLAAMATTTEALRTGDKETFVSGYTDDVFFMGENSAPLIGKEAFAAGMAVPGTEWNETYVEVMVNGDWAHIIGDWTAGDRSGKAIYLFARQNDGSWKISHEFANSNGAQEESR